MKPGIQTLLSEAGESACYALDIIRLAELETGRDFEPVASLWRGITAALIHYGTPDDADNFYVEDPAGFLALLTGRPWTVEKAGPGYEAKEGERVVQRWERVVQRTGTAMTIGHFRLPDWDSLPDSQTVRLGKLASVRVFRRAA